MWISNGMSSLRSLQAGRSFRGKEGQCCVLPALALIQQKSRNQAIHSLKKTDIFFCNTGKAHGPKMEKVKKNVSIFWSLKLGPFPSMTTECLAALSLSLFLMKTSPQSYSIFYAALNWSTRLEEEGTARRNYRARLQGGPQVAWMLQANPGWSSKQEH